MTFQEYVLIFLLFCNTVTHQKRIVDKPPSITQEPNPFPRGRWNQPKGDRVLVYYKKQMEELRLPCVAVGKPELQYKWLKNGEILDFEDPELVSMKTNISRYRMETGIGTLIILETMEIDQGVYQCSASNKHGTAFSVKVEVILAVNEPFAVTNAVQEEVNLGDSKTLKCNPPEMVPEATVFWKDDSSSLEKLKLSERIMIDYEGDLHFANIIKNDTLRTYECGAHLTLQRMFSFGPVISMKMKAKWGISQQSMTDLMWNSKQDVLGLVGEEAKFMCIFSGDPTPSITWKKLNDPKSIEGWKVDQYNHELVNKNLRFSDQGTYQCSGINILQENHRTVKFTLNVEAKPSWVKAPEDVSVSIEGNAIFQCQAQGLPEPTVEWFINGKPIAEVPNSRRTHNGNELRFTNVTEKDSQVIQCNATNTHGSLWADVYLNVLALKPEITSSPGVVKVATNNSVTLTCDHNGYPTPKLTWYKEGLQLDGPQYIFEQNSITIRSTGIENKGTYKCVSQNRFGVAEEEGTLLVRARTIITRPPKDLEVEADAKNVDFACIANTDPNEKANLKYVWLKDGIPIDQNSDKYTFLNNGTYLRIAVVTPEYTGNYTCVADNMLDSASSTAVLRVKGAPNPPVDVKLVSCGDWKLALTWTAGFNNFLPITSYIIESMTEFEPREWTLLHKTSNNQTLLRDVGLSPWVKYKFRVIAQNSKGLSQPSNATTAICSTDPKVPSHHPTGVETIENKAGHLIIQWDEIQPMDQNGAEFKYWIFVRKDGEKKNDYVKNDWQDTVLDLKTNDTYQKYFISVEAHNEMGKSNGLAEDIVGYSGMGKPSVSPSNFERVPNSTYTYEEATFRWDAVNESSDAMKGLFEGYQIRYWKVGYPESILYIKVTHSSDPEESRKKRAAPQKIYATVSNLPPYTDLKLDVVALNTYFKSEGSNVIELTTPEGVPGQVEKPRIDRRGVSSLDLGWYKPLTSNGVIVEYQVAYRRVKGLDVGELSDVEYVPAPNKSESVDARLTYKIQNLDNDTSYRICIWAATSIGTGPKFCIDGRTSPEGLPVTPNIATVVVLGDKVNVTWTFPQSELPVASTHYVEYRKLGDVKYKKAPPVKIEKWQVVDNLNPDATYEVIVTADNGPGFTVSSDRRTIDLSGRGTQTVSEAGLLQATWFIIMMVALAVLILVIIIVCLVRRSRGDKYHVQEKERLRGVEQDDKKTHFNEFNDNGEKQPLAGSPDYDPERGPLESDKDSLEEYGDVDPSKFNEDGSFIGQYGPQNTTPSEVAAPQMNKLL